MDTAPSPLAFILLLLSGWVNRQQQAVIDYLLEENRILRAERGSLRLRLTDDQRRRPAVKGKALGRRRLGDITGIVTLDTIIRWYRRPVAKKYAGSKKRVPPHQAGDGRPRGPHGARQPNLGLHANPWCAEEPRLRRRLQHDQGYPQGPRHRASTGAPHEDGLENVSCRPLGRPGGG